MSVCGGGLDGYICLLDNLQRLHNLDFSDWGKTSKLVE